MGSRSIGFYPEVVVATLDGKAYYKITQLLRSAKIPFVDATPRGKISSKTKIVLTTRKERELIRHNRVILIEDLSSDFEVLKEEIFRELYGADEECLTIGIDPGERIGMVVYYQNRLIEGLVMSSVDSAVRKVVQLVRRNSQAKWTIRIGYGVPKLAEVIARSLVNGLHTNIIVELVDEWGTSSASRTSPNKRGIRDQRSAMIIAFRQGKRYNA